MKHTPGPWRAGSKSVTAPETKDSAGLDVRLYGGNGQQNAANARLIAAAPELLEALQLLLEQDDNGEDEIWVRNKARDAIAKATGEP